MLINKTLTKLSALIIGSMLLTVLNTVSAKQVTLNLKQTDIHSLVETVAEVTGKNFVVDPRVSAEVTVISAHSIDEEALYQVFLSVLQVHGFAAVDLGNVIKILPEGNALQGPINFNNQNKLGTTDELVIRVIKVEHIAPSNLIPIIRPPPDHCSHHQ
jgi:general secretion pathway protein D